MHIGMHIWRSRALTASVRPPALTHTHALTRAHAHSKREPIHAHMCTYIHAYIDAYIQIYVHIVTHTE
jgi:hypothetical protein